MTKRLPPAAAFRLARLPRLAWNDASALPDPIAGTRLPVDEPSGARDLDAADDLARLDDDGGRQAPRTIAIRTR